MSSSALRHRVAVERRPASAGDLGLLRNLFADAHVELAVLPPDTRFVLVDMQFRAQRRQQAAQYPEAEHDILLVDGAEVGHLLVDRSHGECHILDITVALGHRREGIAGSVLSDVVESASAARGRVWVTLWAGNTAARRVFERAGLNVSPDSVAEDGYITMEAAVRPVA